MNTPSIPQDSFGRAIEYLRVSATDRCDPRCSYCLPKVFAASASRRTGAPSTKSRVADGAAYSLRDQLRRRLDHGLRLTLDHDAQHRLGTGGLLQQAATHQDVENGRRLRLLTGVLEPLVIVAMGVVVMLIVLAILMPIIEMIQLVRP